MAMSEFMRWMAYRAAHLLPWERLELVVARVGAQLCELWRDPGSGRPFVPKDFLPTSDVGQTRETPEEATERVIAGFRRLAAEWG